MRKKKSLAAPKRRRKKADGTGTKPPFGYYGAKQRLANEIIESLPPHSAWVEAFCGSAAITLAKAPAPIEVINDRDGNVVNLFRVLRTRRNALVEAVELTPYARDEFVQSGVKKGRVGAVEQARQFLARTMMTVNGDAKGAGFSYSSSYARGGKEARVSRWHNLPPRLLEVAERLRNVRVEHLDAREIVRMFMKRPATLIYLDPPYFVNRGHGYVIDANDLGFHQELLKLCCQAKCMILLSGYDTPLYKKALLKKNGWERVTIDTHTRDTKGKDYVREEVLWMNKHFVRAKKESRVPVRLSKAEIRDGKVNPERH